MAHVQFPTRQLHYPSQLKLFRECRRRYHLKVVERHRVDEPFSPSLEKGKVAHAVLKICADGLMRERPHLPANLADLVAPRLPRDAYPSDASWRHDTAEVINWVKYALSYLDARGEILGAELFLNRHFPSEEGHRGFSVGTVLDLVLLRHDDDGPYIEVIDYKSGRSGRDDPLSPVIARFVLKRLIKRHLPDGGFGRVVYTELYLAEKVPRPLELDLPLCMERWEEIKCLLAEIEAEKAFPPSPSPLCGFCPFNGNGCLAAVGEQANDGELW